MTFIDFNIVEINIKKLWNYYPQFFTITAGRIFHFYDNCIQIYSIYLFCKKYTLKELKFL